MYALLACGGAGEESVAHESRNIIEGNVRVGYLREEKKNRKKTSSDPTRNIYVYASGCQVTTTTKMIIKITVRFAPRHIALV